MAPPSASNALIFCRDLGSANGTYLRSHRLRKHESILLSHGDCLDFRHAGKIYVLQFNVFVANIDKIIGDGNLGSLDRAFQIQRRLIGEGGQAKVPFSDHHHSFCCGNLNHQILLARNRVTKEQVACKVVRLSPAKPKRFDFIKQEIAILSNLDHVYVTRKKYTKPLAEYH